MAKKRTKKQKTSSLARRHQQVKLYLSNNKVDSPEIKLSASKIAKSKTKPLTLTYDIALVKTDLKKTLTISALILGIELILFNYLR